MKPPPYPYIPALFGKEEAQALERFWHRMPAERCDDIFPAVIFTKLMQFPVPENAEAVRQYIDGAFWAGTPVRPGWHHVKYALLTQDRALLDVLAPHAAPPTAEDMGDLLRTMREKCRSPEGNPLVLSGHVLPLPPGPPAQLAYEHCLRQLRRAGLRDLPEAEEVFLPANLSLIEKPSFDIVDGRYIDSRLRLMPREWLSVLRALQENGAKEAVIAGGALRDLFNGRAADNVNIFAFTEGRIFGRRGMLKAAFRDAGVEVVKQAGWDPRESARTAFFPDPMESKTFSSVWGKGQTEERWKVVSAAGTEYQFHFVQGITAGELAVGRLTNMFHFSVDRITCDGRTVSTDETYRKAVAEGRLVMTGSPGTFTRAHLISLNLRNPEWKLCETSQKLLDFPEFFAPHQSTLRHYPSLRTSSTGPR